MAAVTVGTSATPVAAPTGTRRDVALYNAGTGTIYLDTSTSVAASGASQGLPLAQGAYLPFSLGEAQTLYAITAAGTATVNVLAL